MPFSPSDLAPGPTPSVLPLDELLLAYPATIVARAKRFHATALRSFEGQTRPLWEALADEGKGPFAGLDDDQRSAVVAEYSKKLFNDVLNFSIDIGA